MAYPHHRSQFGDTTFTKVFVGGLAWETPTEVMRRYFEQFGDILEAVIITDKATGKSKGYGFVTFRDPESARNAVANPSPMIDGRRANCNIASLGKPRASLSRSGRPQGGGGSPYQGSGALAAPVPVPPPPPPPPPHPSFFLQYGYQYYTPDYGYHQAIYNPQIHQPQYYHHQLYGGGASSSTSTIGPPYFYGGYTLQTPPPTRPHQLTRPPSYYYYPTSPTLHDQSSFSMFQPQYVQPPRLSLPSSTTTTTTDSQTPQHTTAEADQTGVVITSESS